MVLNVIDIIYYEYYLLVLNVWDSQDTDANVPLKAEEWQWILLKLVRTY